jgi:hypothetical protein
VAKEKGNPINASPGTAIVSKTMLAEFLLNPRSSLFAYSKNVH